MSAQSDITSTIFQQIQHKYNELAQRTSGNLINSFIPRHPDAGRSTNGVHVLREELSSLDSRIHSQLLFVDTLHLVLKDAEKTYLSLRVERQRCLEDINALISTHHKPITFPTEIIIKIASYCSPGDFNSIRDVWGDIAYKALPRKFVFFEPPQDGSTPQEECSYIIVQALDNFIEPAPMSDITPLLDQHVPLGRWKEFLLIPYADSTHGDVLGTVRRCIPHLSTVVRIDIGSVVKPPLSGIWHSCSGCLQDVLAPTCTNLSLPLSFLVCFRDFNGGQVSSLTVDLREGLSSSTKIHRSLTGFDIKNIRTLRFHWNHNDTSWVPTAKLVAPNLRKLSFFVDTISSDYGFFALMDLIDCPRLETLEISKEFKGLEVLDVVPAKFKFVQEIGKNFPSLTRLSLYLQSPATDANFQLIFSILEDLQMRVEDQMPLPRLTYLALPHRWSNFGQLRASLVKLLQNREEAGAPLHTIEIMTTFKNSHAINQTSQDQQLQIDRMGLLVKELIVI